MKSALLAVALAVMAKCSFAQERAEYVLQPTHADVSYGSHERNVLDFWQANAEEETPLVIYIHGGGFVGGDKSKLSQNVLKKLLDANISVATLNYRFLSHAPLPGAHRDVVRAIQYLRSKSREWKIDRKRVGAFGGSAGAQLVMYLAFHDDLADPDSDEPTERESTRLTCAAPSAGQVTMKMKWWDENVPGYRTGNGRTRDLARYFGTSDEAQANKINEQIAALSLISKDDPPVYMTYAMAPTEPIPEDDREISGWMIHHVNHGVALQRRCDELGVEAWLKFPKKIPKYRNATDFLKAKLLRAQ